MKRFPFVFAALALGALLALSACGEKEDPTPDPVDLLDMLYPDGQAFRDQEIRSTAMKQTMKYTVWLPPKFDKEKAYPILYLLHGAGDDQNAWLDKGNAMSIAGRYVKTGGTPMIIVMPDAQLTFYLGDYETYFHKELMPQVESDYKFSGKRAVAGLSMGGFGTIYHALRYPDKFTYAYAMSPATSMDMLGITLDDMKAMAAALAGVSPCPGFTIEVGNQDTTVKNADAKELSDAINATAHCEWIARDGIHYWNFWQECLPKALKKAGESFK